MPRHQDVRYALLVALYLQSFLGQAARAELPARLPATTSPKAMADAEPANDRDKAFDEQRRKVQERLRQVQIAVNSQSQGGGANYLVRELELLKWIDLLYSSCETARQQHEEMQLEAAQLDGELLTGSSPTEQLSFVEWDELRDQLLIEENRIESLQLEVEAARAALVSARESKEESDARRRLTRDQMETEKDLSRREKLRREHELQQLTSLGFELTVRQQQVELDIKSLQQQISERRRDSFQQRVDTLRGKTAFGESDLEARIKQIDAIEASFQQLIAQVHEKLQEADRQWLAAQHAYDQTAPRNAVVAEQLVAWRQARDLRQERLSFLKQVTTYVGIVRSSWRRRYQLVNDLGSQGDYGEWYETVGTLSEELARFTRLVAIRANEHFGDAATLKKRLLGGQAGPADLTHWIDLQLAEVDDAINQYTSMMVMLKAADRFLQRFSEDLRLTIEPTSARETLAYLQQCLQLAWDYEITSVDDRPITVAKVVYGIMLLVIGIFLARILSRLVGKRILPRFGLNPGAAQAFQSISFYLMLTCFGCLSLEMINLPLTIFAFMGGAVAIGVGFGSQNILNNFISGLIVLAERPIRVGDLVEIGGLTGTIERIGARSTRVKTGSNLEIIVPNSTFLENNVTNWTLSDTRIRTRISVGVAYGSPTTEVSRLLSQTVSEHHEVLSSPEPIVLFKDFGDNSLLFEVHFWLHMQTMMQAEKVASDIRHRIDELFADAQITIAYPQRDIHLDTLAPIEVNLRSFTQDNSASVRRHEAA